MSYLRKKLQAIMACADFKGYLREVTGYPLTLTDCMESDLVSLSVTGNAVQDGTPSPDAPVEVQGCGERTGNLFDITNLNLCMTSTSSIDYTPKVENGVFYSGGQSDKASGQFPYVEIGDAETVTISFTVSGEAPSGYIYGFDSVDDDGVVIGNVMLNNFSNSLGTITFAYTGAKQYIGICVFSQNRYGVALSNIQIIKGSYTADTMPPYEPYGYKIPVEVSGRNLFDVQGIIDTTEAIDLEMTEYQGRQCLSWRENMYTSSHKFMQGVFAENTQYTFALTGYAESDTRAVHIYVIYTDGTNSMFNIPLGGWNTTCVTTLAGKTVSHWRGGHHAGDRVYIDIANSQILEGSYTAATIPPYEPYHEPQTVSVYMDKPLYAVGDVGDTITLDFDAKTAVLIKNFDKLILTDDISFNGPTNIGDTGFYRYYFLIPAMKFGVGVEGLCNVLPEYHVWNEGDFEHVHFGQNNCAVYIILGNEYSNDSDIISYLRNQGETEPYFIYPLATPTTTDISALQDWDAFPPTWRGTVTISADTSIPPSSMTARYYATQKED